MRSKTRFRVLLQAAAPSDRHILRKAADVMEAQKLTPQALVKLDAAELERLLRARNVPKAASTARRIPLALTRLAVIHPGENLPVAALKPSPRNIMPRRRDEPRRFRLDLVVVGAALKHARATMGVDGHKPLTDYTILRSAREYRAAAARAGISMNDDLGLEALTYEPLALATIDCLKKEHTLKTIGKILGGVIAAAELVLGPDHPHVLWLRVQRQSKPNQPSRALTHTTEKKLGVILACGGVSSLLQVPRRIEASLSDAYLGRKDEIGRRQLALLAQLKLDHPALSGKQAVALHLGNEIEEIDGCLHLRLWPAWKDAESCAEPLSPEGCRLLRALTFARKRTGLDSLHLFPSRAELFPAGAVNKGENLPLIRRQTGPTLSTLSAEIKKHTGYQLTFQDLQDLIVAVLLESGIEPFVVARRAGYRYTRSLEIRMRTRFQAGLV